MMQHRRISIALRNKEFNQGIEYLEKKKIINLEQKNSYTEFRDARNGYVHYGRIVFCQFIFDNSGHLYNLLDMLVGLFESFRLDPIKLNEFNLMQLSFLDSMKEVLNQFVEDNVLIA